ncbi:hypothetical protein FOZ63_023771 [Perkinsus olseni]|uniref:Glycerol-3-phosphate dehydrogenase [NAD(+)] n=1 Tax=Perkinsus olseni TaxID=32597 RepID=A0A7J6SCE1_PEROL|nr:hypothetical protein FOZ62_025811 [Perkinsus olseni]KAF4730222.1 hypothetical protein FOZ63_023771 [Perkinsus olseni]
MATCIVFGAGAFGTAMSAALARSSAIGRVYLYGRDRKVIDGINRYGINERIIPQVGTHRLDTDKILATTSLHDLPQTASSYFHAIPVQQSMAFLRHLEEAQFPLGGSPYVNCSKGVMLYEGNKLMTVSQMFGHCLGLKGHYMALSGPAFAQGLLEAAPCVMSLAGGNGEVAEMLRASQGMFIEDTPQLTVEAVEWAGAMKNVCALAYGWVEASLDCNTAAAVVTVMWRELFGLLGREDESSRYSFFESSAGLGDLLVTCGGGKSRNVGYGRDVAAAQQRGGPVATDLTGRPTVEGLYTMKALLSFYGPHRIPCTGRIIEGLQGLRNPAAAVENALRAYVW